MVFNTQPFKYFIVSGVCLVGLMLSSCSSMKNWVQEHIVKDEVRKELQRSKPDAQHQDLSKDPRSFGPQDPQRATSESPFGFTWNW